MTLVVATATADIGYLVADTLLVSSMQIKRNPIGPVNGEFHALKIHVLDAHTAVAFSTANDADTALKLINEIHDELRANPEVVVPKRLHEKYEEEIKKRIGEIAPDCEFLVLKLAAKGKTLAHVTKDAISYCERAYIGDQQEYKRLMALRQPYVPPATQTVQQPDGKFVTKAVVPSTGEIEFSETTEAMEQLVHERRNASVGAIAGCVIRVVDARVSGELEYLQSGEVGISPWEGKLGYSCLCSNTDVRGIGIYFKAGKVGFVMIVGDLELCRKIKSETVQEFIEAANENYGMKLTGPT